MKRPADHSLERAVIGVCLAHADRLREFRALLTDADFDNRMHLAIWHAMGKVDAHGADVDLASVEREMRLADTLGLVPQGVIGLGEIADTRASIGNIPLHAKALRSLTRARRMHEAMCNAMDDWDEEDPDGWVHGVATRVAGVSRGEIASRPTLSQQIDDMLESVMAEAEGRVVRVDTPWEDVNVALNGGLEPGQLFVVAARPGLGKSAFGLGAAMHCAERGVPSFYLNREMIARGQLKRAVSQRTRVALSKAGGRNASASELTKIIAAGNTMRSLPLTIVDDAGDIDSVVSVLRDWRRKFDGVGLIVVDYLQLLSAKGCDGRTQEVGKVARALKDVALMLKVPVIALAQLNRDGDGDPSMRHLRESGEIEAAADLVGILLRPKDDQGKEIPGVAEMFFDKCRDAARARVRLAWLGDFVTFGNYDNNRREWR